MKKYWLIFKIAVQDSLEYRLNFILMTLRYSMSVTMMALVWIAVAKDNPSGEISLPFIIDYYFFSAIIFSLSSFHTRYIEDDIKQGELSKYLLKPISAFGNYFSMQFAKTSIGIVINMLTIFPLLLIIGMNATPSIAQLFIGLSLLPAILIFCMNLYSLVSFGTFWFNEIYAIRWGVIIVVRFLSGFMVPINFLSDSFQKVSFWLPFQHLAYTPVQLFRGDLSVSMGLLSFVVLLFWILVVTIIRKKVWSLGVRSFEGTGI